MFSWSPENLIIGKCWIRDDSGELGESEIAQFEGGHPEESWHGKWITAPFSQGDSTGIFQVGRVPEIDEIEKARLYVCGLGLYEVYINGKKVGDQFLTPYFIGLPVLDSVSDHGCEGVFGKRRKSN